VNHLYSAGPTFSLVPLAQVFTKMSVCDGSASTDSDLEELPPSTSSQTVLSITFNNKKRSTWKEARTAYDRLKSDPRKNSTWCNTYLMEIDGQENAFTLHCAGCDHSIQLKNPVKFFKEHKCSANRAIQTLGMKTDQSLEITDSLGALLCVSYLQS
jgi:hypothetical protein